MPFSESLIVSRKLPASLGEKFWSIRSLIRHKVQSSLYWQQSLNMQEYPLSEGKENPQAPHQNSFLRPGIRALHTLLSLNPVRMVFLLVCQVQWLFYQSIAYLSVYVTKIRNNKDTLQILLEKPHLKRFRGWII